MWEMLRFAARLSLPSEIPGAKSVALCEQTLATMGLWRVRHTKVSLQWSNTTLQMQTKGQIDVVGLKREDAASNQCLVTCSCRMSSMKACGALFNACTSSSSRHVPSHHITSHHTTSHHITSHHQISIHACQLHLHACSCCHQFQHLSRKHSWRGMQGGLRCQGAVSAGAVRG